MDRALRRAVVELGVAPEVAAAAAASTPARVLGLEGVTGALTPGLAADLVVVDTDFRVRRVMLGGRWMAKEGANHEQSA
jgi:N-acetylglucosamine-6-phosphate deacetylase